MERRRVAANFFDRAAGEQLGRAEDELAAIAGFDPAVVSFESHRAGAEWNPILLAEN